MDRPEPRPLSVCVPVVGRRRFGWLAVLVAAAASERAECDDRDGDEGYCPIREVTEGAHGKLLGWARDGSQVICA